jgi:hypothetical protein
MVVGNKATVNDPPECIFTSMRRHIWKKGDDVRDLVDLVIKGNLYRSYPWE